MKNTKLLFFTLLTTLLCAEEGLLFSGSSVEVSTYPYDGVEQSTVSLKAGSLGVGIDLSKHYTEKIGFRLNLNGITYNENKEVSEINYDADISLLTVGVLADYFPVLESSFRVSAGIYYNDNHGDGLFKPSQSTQFMLGYGQYDGNDIVAVEAGAYYENSVAPYVGIGWEKKNIVDGVGFTLDIGGLYQGPTKVYATATVDENLPESLKTQIKNDVETERIQIEKDLESYEWYPVIMVGVNYSF